MPDSTIDDPDPSRSRWTRFALWGGSIVGALLLLVLVAALLLPQLFTSEQLKSYVVPPLEDATGRQVEIDAIGLRVLWTPAVSVSGFRLANREGYGPEPSVEAEELNVEVALWPLITGRIEPSTIELVNPVVRYEVAEDGTGNFDDLMAADTTKTADEEAGLPAIPVSNFETTGARLRYTDQSTGQTLFLNFDARLNALPDGRAITSEGAFDVTSLRAVLPDLGADTMRVTDAQLDYDVRADLSAGTVDFSAFTIETAPFDLSTTGTVTRLNTRPTLDLTVETTRADLAQLAAFAPAAAVDGLNPTGSLQLTTRITGPLSDSTGTLDSLSVDGTGQLSGIGADYEGAALLRNLGADLALSLDGVSLQSLNGQLLGASLDGNARVDSLRGTPRVDLDLKTGAMNLADLSAFAPPEQVKAYNPAGTLQLDISVMGPIPEDGEWLENLGIDGTGTLAGVGVDYEGSALLRNLGADLSFSNTTASLQSIAGRLLEKPLNGEITVRDLMGSPTVDGRLAGGADLAQLTALTSDGSGEGAESVRGNAEYDVRFSGPVDDPDAIRPEGRIRLTDLQYPYESFRHPIEIPDATVQLTGTGLSMNRFTLHTGKQELALETTIRNLFPISKGLAETSPAMSVNFSASSDRLDLIELYPEEQESDVYYSELFAAALSGSQVDGQSPEALARELYGGTELPAFPVDGRVDIGTFLNDPQRIDDLGVDVQIQNRRLALRNLTGTTYGGQLAGTVTFDQSGSTSASHGIADRSSVLLASRTATPPQPALSSHLDYDIELEGAKASAFLADWTSIGEIISGTLTLNMRADTPLTEGFLPVSTALRGEGTSIVADGGLSSDFPVTKHLVDKLGLTASAFTQFRRLGGPFTIEEGTLSLGIWEFGGLSAPAQLSGGLGLAGNVDLDFRMQLPLSTLQNSRIPGLVGGADGRLGGIVQKLAGSGQGDATIPVRVSIGGTMRNPTVEVVDKDAVRSSIQELVKEEGLGRVRNLFEGG